MMSRMPRACCRASPVHMPTASKTQRSSVVDVLDMFSNSQGAPHKVTKAWNGKVSKSHAEPYMARLFLSKSGRFRCRKLRFGAESTEVKWYGWGVPRVQYLTDSEMSTCQLLHSASTASTPPWDHPIPCQKSSAPAICRQLHTIHGRWQSFLHWCYTFDATNMKNSSHQGKTYKL